MIKGYKLHHFLVNPRVPSKYQTDAHREADLVSNAYADWESREQILLSWLQSMISREILPRLIGCKTSAKLWDRIHTFFISLSAA